MKHTWRKPRSALVLPLLLVAFPMCAHAHTPVEGVGEFVSGLLHPVTTSTHILVLLGLGLLIGQQSPLNLKTPLLVFAPLSAVALGLTTMGWFKAVYPPVLLIIALGVGILVALEKTVPRMASWLLFGAAALAIGFDSPVESNSTAAVAKTLSGTWISLIVLLADIAFYASLGTKRKWSKVGIRVLGSWLIAISLLVLAFSLKKDITLNKPPVNASSSVP